MSKLHELLAVEPDLKSTADSILNETQSVFQKKVDHFVGMTRSYDVIMEGAHQQPTESKQMVTTVKDKLDHMQKSQVRLIDAMYQKELANTTAKADIVYEGEVLAKDVPATVLLDAGSCQGVDS